MGIIGDGTYLLENGSEDVLYDLGGLGLHPDGLLGGQLEAEEHARLDAHLGAAQNVGAVARQIHRLVAPSREHVERRVPEVVRGNICCVEYT